MSQIALGRANVSISLAQPCERLFKMENCWQACNTAKGKSLEIPGQVGSSYQPASPCVHQTPSAHRASWITPRSFLFLQRGGRRRATVIAARCRRFAPASSAQPELLSLHLWEARDTWPCRAAGEQAAGSPASIWRRPVSSNQRSSSTARHQPHGLRNNSHSIPAKNYHCGLKVEDRRIMGGGGRSRRRRCFFVFPLKLTHQIFLEKSRGQSTDCAEVPLHLPRAAAENCSGLVSFHPVPSQKISHALSPSDRFPMRSPLEKLGESENKGGTDNKAGTTRQLQGPAASQCHISSTEPDIPKSAHYPAPNNITRCTKGQDVIHSLKCFPGDKSVHSRKKISWAQSQKAITSPDNNQQGIHCHGHPQEAGEQHCPQGTVDAQRGTAHPWPPQRHSTSLASPVQHYLRCASPTCRMRASV